MFDVIPTNGERWLICGGREFSDEEMFNSAMGDLIRLKGMPKVIIHGNAAGADTMADKWANRHALIIDRYTPDWNKHGKAAGPIRNQDMIDLGKPDLVIAFPGGRGTLDMVSRAHMAEVDVAEIKPRANAVKCALCGKLIEDGLEPDGCELRECPMQDNQ